MQNRIPFKKARAISVALLLGATPFALYADGDIGAEDGVVEELGAPADEGIAPVDDGAIIDPDGAGEVVVDDGVIEPLPVEGEEGGFGEDLVGGDEVVVDNEVIEPLPVEGEEGVIGEDPGLLEETIHIDGTLTLGGAEVVDSGFVFVENPAGQDEVVDNEVIEPLPVEDGEVPAEWVERGENGEVVAFGGEVEDTPVLGSEQGGVESEMIPFTAYSMGTPGDADTSELADVDANGVGATAIDTAAIGEIETLVDAFGPLGDGLEVDVVVQDGAGIGTVVEGAPQTGGTRVSGGHLIGH